MNLLVDSNEDIIEEKNFKNLLHSFGVTILKRNFNINKYSTIFYLISFHYDHLRAQSP